MRRKKGQLLPLEVSVLEAGIELQSRRVPEFYGFLIAKEITEREGAAKLTAYGTLYKALSRMEEVGLLTSYWENHVIAEVDSRPRRRLYTVTAQGETALVTAQSQRAEVELKRQEGLAAS